MLDFTYAKMEVNRAKERERSQGAYLPVEIFAAPQAKIQPPALDAVTRTTLF